jgi:hypothetical protein
MDTGGVRGLVQRFEEIREVQASQSTRDAGLGGLKRRKLEMESDIEKDTYSNPGKLVRHIVSGRRGSPSRRQAGGSPSSPRRARAVGGSVWTRPAGSGKVRAGQGGLRVPPVGGAGQHSRPGPIPSTSSSSTTSATPPTPTSTMPGGPQPPSATPLVLAPVTNSVTGKLDREGGPPLAGGTAIPGCGQDLVPC